MQHPEPHDLTALAYGLIEGTERESLLTHVSECDDCRAVYDSYRDEQAAVRDSIVRDARSGAAEAKALESTLKMLGTIEDAKPRGRLLRLPRWVLVAEVAAMLAVAVGLFFILRPTNEPEIVPVADELRAPAEVSGGVVYVSDRQGEWKPAEALPEDEWVMAGQEGQLVLTLDNGSRAKIEPGCVFRLGRDGESSQPMLQFLRGNGEIDTSDMTANMFVRSGEAGFYAMPQARFTIASELPEGVKVRSWAQSSRVKASVNAGDVVLWPAMAKYNKLPLKGGDKVEWTREDFKVYTEGGKALPVRAFWNSSENPEAGEVYAFLLELEPRLEAFRKRIENLPKSGDPRATELRQTFLSGPGFDVDQDIQIVVQPLTGINDSARIELKDGGVKRVIVVRTDGVTISVDVKGGAVRRSYESGSVEELKTGVPADILELLDGVKFARDAAGLHRIEGAHIEGKGASVIVTSNSEQTAEKKD
ncbi:MAG: hypothetical protein K8I27_12030 [Planctomycetes bacterium]|nr:hypothetical protein [Planctomycetota bacterium]